MPSHVSAVLAVVASLTFLRSQTCDASATNPNGAIHARVTANGFNYINQVLRQQLEAEVNRLNIPAVSGNERRVSYEVKNIRIERLAPGPSSIQSTTRGLRWQLSFNEIRVRADWNFRYKKGWVKISDDGHVTASVKNLRFDITLNPRVVNGKLAVIPASTIPNSCASVGSLDARIGGSFWSWLYNILANAFKRRLRDKIPAAVCRAAGRAVERWSGQVFPHIETTDQIELFNETFLLDYSLINPQFQNGLANIRFLGEIFPEPKTFQSFPFAPSPMPATATEKHVYLVVSDFVANTFLHSVKVKGIANQSRAYSTGLFHYSINNALENACQKIAGYGRDGDESGACADFEFSFALGVEDPKMFFSKANGITLELNKAEINIKTKTGNQTKQLLKVQIDIKVSARPTLSKDGRKLHFDFATPQVTFNLMQPSIPDDVQRQVQYLVRVAGARYGRRALNKFGKKGVKLPNVKGKIDIQDREIMIEDGALVIAANLVVKYVASTRCGMLTCGIFPFYARDPFVCMLCHLIDNEDRDRHWIDCRFKHDFSVNDHCQEKAWELHLGNGSAWKPTR